MLTWQTVETLAIARGTPRKTLRMWRERGVPARARIELFQAAQGGPSEFRISEFDGLPLRSKAKPKRRAA